MAYVPPVARQKDEESKEHTPTDDKNVAISSAPTRNFTKANRLPNENDIHSHFWPVGETDDEGTTLRLNPSPSTLNASAASPDTLCYVMLFKDANPRWKSDRIIFVKTNLGLLPGYSEQSLSNAKVSDHDDGNKLAEETAVASDNAKAPVGDVGSKPTEMPAVTPDNAKTADNTEWVKLSEEPAALPKHAKDSDDKGSELIDEPALASDNWKISDNTEWIKLTAEPSMPPNGKTNTPNAAVHSSMEPKQEDQSEESEQEDGGVKLGAEHVNLSNLSVQPESTATNDTNASISSSITKQADEPTPEESTSSNNTTSPPSPQTDQAPSLLTTPIAVFEQQQGRNGGFTFLGYHTLAHFDFLAPNSEPLIRMLEQKFSHKDRFGNVKQKQRNAAAWRTSLSQPWAVLNLAPDSASAGLPAPVIKYLEGRERRNHKRDRDRDQNYNRNRNRDRTSKSAEDKEADGPAKTVNELLREMRLEPTDASAQAMERRSSASASASAKPGKATAAARSEPNRPTDPPASFDRSAWSAAAIAKTDAERLRAREEVLKDVAEQPLPEFKETFKQRGGGGDGEDGEGSGGEEKVALAGEEGSDTATDASGTVVSAPAISTPAVSAPTASAATGAPALSTPTEEVGDQKSETGEMAAEKKSETGGKAVEKKNEIGEKNKEDSETSEEENDTTAELDAGCRL